jgi:hypothetical protein
MNHERGISAGPKRDASYATKLATMQREVTEARRVYKRPDGLLVGVRVDASACTGHEPVEAAQVVPVASSDEVAALQREIAALRAMVAGQTAPSVALANVADGADDDGLQPEAF